MKKKCTKCLQTKPLTDYFKRKDTKDGLRYWCKKCHTRYATMIRKPRKTPNHIKNARNRMKTYLSKKENRIKVEARNIFHTAVANGTIKRQLCCIEGCKSDKSEAHHPDYTKPLQVLWLCKKHHTDVHFNNLKVS